jgi:hypothetical protein
MFLKWRKIYFAVHNKTIRRDTPLDPVNDCEEEYTTEVLPVPAGEVRVFSCLSVYQ